MVFLSSPFPVDRHLGVVTQRLLGKESCVTTSKRGFKILQRQNCGQVSIFSAKYLNSVFFILIFFLQKLNYWFVKLFLYSSSLQYNYQKMCQCYRGRCCSVHRKWDNKCYSQVNSRATTRGKETRKTCKHFVIIELEPKANLIE